MSAGSAAPPLTVTSWAAFHLIAGGPDPVAAVECAACGTQWPATLSAIAEAMGHSCQLTHRCQDHCPTCHPKAGR